MTAISRRNFLLAGGAVLAIPPLEIAIRAAASSHGETIARILQDRLPGLTIPAERLIEFGDEFARRHLPDLGRRFRGALLIMDNDWAEDLLPESWRFRYDAFARNLMTEFLFSTDLFTTAGGELARASYVAYFDPYVTGCANPLARFDMT
ncbi:MAG: hypothetical protein H6917_16870 [Novosphingobium sp.]|nr:hypothetical protein [Novosphingobium sp.]MCP5404047.1 hypothetical protein [Novosphingobium sp.]